MTEDVYRTLQQHLDSLPVGFPATESGVEIRILKHVFTPEEAKIASKLKFAWKDFEPLDSIYERLKILGYTKEELEKHLDNMASKGGISKLIKDGVKTYASAMFVVGIFEYQVNKLTKEFVEDFHEYFEEFGKGTARVPISQLRTIPVGFSIEHEAKIATYDDIKSVFNNIEEPIALMNCVCRQTQEVIGKKCEKTSRMESCMAYGNLAQAVIDAGEGRQLSKEEALEVLKKNEEEGLVFQPGNVQKPDFICSCCSCCCEALSNYAKLPDPSLIVQSNYYAVVDADLCTGCETCIDRCPMDAIDIEDNISVVNLRRCIGCGNCIVTCPSEAISLAAKDKHEVPVETGVDLYNKIAEQKAKILARKKRRAERFAKKQ